MAALCGVSYFLVYALDLGNIFPVSPTKMPRTLFWVEVAGLILSIPLTFLSLIYIFMPKADGNVFEISSGTMIQLLVVVISLGVGIVIFATKSAMRQSPNNNPVNAKKRGAD